MLNHTVFKKPTQTFFFLAYLYYICYVLLLKKMHCFAQESLPEIIYK